MKILFLIINLMGIFFFFEFKKKIKSKNFFGETIENIKNYRFKET